jgi:hypothetical protein
MAAYDERGRRNPSAPAAFMTTPLCELGPMNALLQRLSRWFHSFDEDDDPPNVAIETPEDGARIGMVGWY